MKDPWRLKREQRPNAPYVAFHHSEGALVQDEQKAIQQLQAIDIQHTNSEKQGWAGFAYSYAISYPDFIWEGKGEFVGVHTRNFNSVSKGIVFLGNFIENPLPDSMVLAGRWLVQQLRNNHQIKQDAEGHPHHWFVPTQCPGRVEERIPDMMRAPVLSTSSIVPEELDMRPFLLFRFVAANIDPNLRVAQYGPTDYRRVVGPQYTAFQQMGIPEVEVHDQDAVDIMAQVAK